MKKAVRMYVNGIVQGVFFRNFVNENARKNDIKGFVRNLDDGRVEIFIEGDGERVKKMIEDCQKGTNYSRVDSVEVRQDIFQGLKEFKILHI